MHVRHEIWEHDGAQQMKRRELHSGQVIGASEAGTRVTCMQGGGWRAAALALPVFVWAGSIVVRTCLSASSTLSARRSDAFIRRAGAAVG